MVASGNGSRGIFNQTFQFIGLMATDGTLIAANRTALEFAGIREPDAIGKPFWETPWWVHSPQLQDRLRQAVRDAAGGRVVHFEATHPRPDGKIAFVDFSLKPVRDELGEITLLIPEGRDITERKLAEQALRISQEQLACLFNASPLPEVRYGLTDGRILDVNQQFLKVFEISRDEAIGQTGVEFGIWCDVAARSTGGPRATGQGRRRLRSAAAGSQRTRVRHGDFRSGHRAGLRSDRDSTSQRCDRAQAGRGSVAGERRAFPSPRGVRLRGNQHHR